MSSAGQSYTDCVPALRAGYVADIPWPAKSPPYIQVSQATQQGSRCRKSPSLTFIVAGLLTTLAQLADLGDECVCGWSLVGPTVVLVVEVGCDPFQHASKGELIREIGRWALGEGG